jgi:hypothetical protein
MKTVTVTLTLDDAEPILLRAAEDAAKFGGWLDYVTRRTYNAPTGHGETLDAARKRWQPRYAAARRVVRAFGIDPEETSEEEALTITHPYKGGKRVPVNVGGLIHYTRIEGSQPDYNDPMPCYRSDVHAEACRQAAKRTVRLWRATVICT